MAGIDDKQTCSHLRLAAEVEKCRGQLNNPVNKRRFQQFIKQKSALNYGEERFRGAVDLEEIYATYGHDGLESAKSPSNVSKCPLDKHCALKNCNFGQTTYAKAAGSNISKTSLQTQSKEVPANNMHRVVYQRSVTNELKTTHIQYHMGYLNVTEIFEYRKQTSYEVVQEVTSDKVAEIVDPKSLLRQISDRVDRVSALREKYFLRNLVAKIAAYLQKIYPKLIARQKTELLASLDCGNSQAIFDLLKSYGYSCVCLTDEDEQQWNLPEMLSQEDVASIKAKFRDNLAAELVANNEKFLDSIFTSCEYHARKCGRSRMSYTKAFQVDQNSKGH